MKKQQDLDSCNNGCAGHSEFIDAWGIHHFYCALRHREIVSGIDINCYSPGSMLTDKPFPDWCPLEEVTSSDIPHMDGKPYVPHPTCIDTDGCGQHPEGGSQVNLWRMEPKSDILLFDQQHGYIRKGDFIAIALIVESYRRQFARDYKMLIDWHHDGIKMWHWFEDYKAPDDFPDLSWDWHLITGDTWMFADRCHMQYGIVPKLSNVPPQGDHVAIIPIFDAIYNCDRNWRLDLTARLIAMVKEAGEVPVVVGTTKTLAALRTVSPNATYIVDDLRRAGDAVLSAKLVIGGDTGLTHLAAVNASRAPVISLQGYGATARARNNFNTWAKHLQNAFYSYAQASENRCYAPKRAPNKPGVDMLMTVTRELTPAQWKEIEQWLQFNISA